MNIPKERYNTIGALIAVLFIFLSMGTLSHYQEKLSSEVTVLLGGGIFFGFFLIHAVAQMLSGYTWKNLVPWNNGVSREDAPVKFWTEIALELAFGGSIFVLCIISVANGWTH
ncbi:hypothetical protein [Cerasicoccus fimbriatus]|uniref:hypothetical protein n=1 Tax=Cerasicoccus fimbriatus TaxID=3014554 RepID=UPI0022B2DED3|nr:hypothetical protein [Cerasicoccus sp. TK19100]